MKCHIPSKDQIIKNLSQQVSQEIVNDTREKTIRKMIKVTCIALNERYHFGPKRLLETVQHISDIFADEASGDEEFWYHLDKRLEQIGVKCFLDEDIDKTSAHK